MRTNSDTKVGRLMLTRKHPNADSAFTSQVYPATNKEVQKISAAPLRLLVARRSGVDLLTDIEHPKIHSWLHARLVLLKLMRGATTRVLFS